MGLAYGRGVALARIAIGIYFLVQGIAKVSAGWLSTPDPLVQMLSSSLERGQVEGFYRPFLQNVVLPNGLLFSQLVAFGEVGVGLSLVLGMLTPIGALVGMWLSLQYMLMKGLPNSAGSIDRLFFTLEIVMLATAAGLVWGLDGLVWRQRRRPSVEREEAVAMPSPPELPRERAA